MSPVPSIKDGSRPIDRWKWRWVGLAFDNLEDGVSGAQALVWVDGQLVPYMPNAWAPWRAHCWSASQAKRYLSPSALLRHADQQYARHGAQGFGMYGMSAPWTQASGRAAEMAMPK